MIFALQNNRVFRSYAGGTKLNELFCTKLPENFPEEWVGSTVTAFNPGRPVENEGLSKMTDGRYLKDIIAENPTRYLGAKTTAVHGEKPSVLVKLLDASERLVIQAHPTVKFAREHFGSPFGKTECWYMLDCDPDAAVYFGFRPGITREKWKDCFLRQDIDAMLNLLHRIPVKKGDLLLVEGGVPHAIGAGCFLLELQEPTDLMVIPEKVTPSGRILPEEKLHCGLGYELMFDCFVYEGFSEENLRKRYLISPTQLETGIFELIGSKSTDKFRMVELQVESELVFNLNDSFAIMTVLEGEGDINGIAVKTGDRFFLSAETSAVFCSGTFRAVVCMP